MRTGSLPTMRAWPLPSVPPRRSPAAATRRRSRCASPCSAAACSRPRRTSSRAWATRDASAEAISREAGMSKATFYEHFANKEECILALFDEAATEVMRAMVGGVRRRGPRLLRGARGRRRARLPGDARRLSRPRRRRCSCRSSARARAPPRAATRSSTPSPSSLVPRQPARRAAVRRAHASPRPTTPSRSSAPRSSSSRAACAPAGPPDVLALEPVITRLMLGVLQRA